jgi:hypothetical protein
MRTEALSDIMPKASKKKYYAVRSGREGPKIYDSWEEVSANTRKPCKTLVQRSIT